MRAIVLAMIVALAACGQVQTDDHAADVTQAQAVAHFDLAVSRVTPVAEQLCRNSAGPQNCDFRIVVDDRTGLSANAHQSLTPDGRPVLTFTSAMITQARNQDEIAFIVAHEAAHHIANHIPRLRQLAAPDISPAAMAAAPDQIVSPEGLAQARAKLKEFELEADALGTKIAAAAGFDPLHGARIFLRLRDPGDHASGTHPANKDRLRAVQQAARET